MKNLIKKVFPRWTWDKEARAGILKLQDGEPDHQVIVEIPEAKTKKRFIADLDANGEVLSIEVLDFDGKEKNA